MPRKNHLVSFIGHFRAVLALGTAAVLTACAGGSATVADAAGPLVPRVPGEHATTAGGEGLPDVPGADMHEDRSGA
ncbi:hypothetical protein [Myceligenerans crystallogenes]